MIRVAFNRTNHSANIKDGGQRPVWVLEDSKGDVHFAHHVDFGENAVVRTGTGEYRKTLCSATYWIESVTPVMVDSDPDFGGTYQVE